MSWKEVQEIKGNNEKKNLLSINWVFLLVIMHFLTLNTYTSSPFHLVPYHWRQHQQLKITCDNIEMVIYDDICSYIFYIHKTPSSA